MNKNHLQEIIDIIEQSNIDILKLEKGDFKLFYQKPNVQKVVIDDKETSVNNDLKQGNETLFETEFDATPTVTKEIENIHQIVAPMIGTFYARPNPEAEPFVQIGTKITKSDPVCILEAMKLLNEVPADVDGEIVDILVNDGDIIEFGQPLFTVRVDG